MSKIVPDELADEECFNYRKVEKYIEDAQSRSDAIESMREEAERLGSIPWASATQEAIGREEKLHLEEAASKLEEY